jgi:hypothetical protein
MVAPVPGLGSVNPAQSFAGGRRNAVAMPQAVPMSPTAPAQGSGRERLAMALLGNLPQAGQTAGETVGNVVQSLANTFIQNKLGERADQRRADALEQYRQTGDLTALYQADPELAGVYAQQADRRYKRQMDERRFGLDERRVQQGDARLLLDRANTQSQIADRQADQSLAARRFQGSPAGMVEFLRGAGLLTEEDAHVIAAAGPRRTSACSRPKTGRPSRSTPETPTATSTRLWR